jgi:uncharacterized membrane protein
MVIPEWALLLSFWLHMAATVAWLGGLAALALVVIPSAKKSLSRHDFASWLTALNQRLDPIGWFSLGILVFTGLLQMDASPNYAGFLTLSNAWAVAICLKHIVFFGMIGVSGYLTWGVAPAMRRAAFSRGAKQGNNRLDFWLRRFQLLIGVNLGLGLLILVFTALARVS